MHTRHKLAASAGATALALMAAVGPATSASAAVDDSFFVSTGPSTCADYGIVTYIDHGDVYGDDYAAVYDACADGVGVKAWFWINKKLIGAQRNGDGFNTEIYVDLPNVKKGDTIGLKICAQNGPNGTPFSCGEETQTSDDG